MRASHPIQSTLIHTQAMSMSQMLPKVEAVSYSWSCIRYCHTTLLSLGALCAWGNYVIIVLRSLEEITRRDFASEALPSLVRLWDGVITASASTYIS